ncbi:MAG: transcription elongation factor GreA [Deltaproteobacteria bacterium]|nr:MAG: transcription elongation factor GreA [Deltaproteobacteria bacterium]
MSETFPMTPACLERLRAELRQLKGEERAKNVAEIEAAREHGDLRENAEFHAAKERQAALDARMRYLEHRIARAQVIDPAKISSDRVGFGATVTVLDMETDEERTYVLVGEDETDVDRGRISIASPLARALVGKSEGDVATVRLPRGEAEYEIVRVEYKALEP